MKLVKCEKLQVSVAEGGVRCFVTFVVTHGSSAANLVQHVISLYMVQSEGRGGHSHFRSHYMEKKG